MSSFRSSLPYLLVILVGITDIFCGDASVSFVKPATSLPPTNQKDQNSAFARPSWLTGNQSSTTPWPALGSRPQINKPRDWVAPSQVTSPTNNPQLPSNRNVGVDLSYGLGNKQHTPNPKQSNSGNLLNTNTRNIGVDLSYGLDPNRNIKAQSTPKPNPVTGQNTNVKPVVNPTTGKPQSVPSYSNVLKKNLTVSSPVTGFQAGKNPIQRTNSPPGSNSGPDRNQQQTNSTLGPNQNPPAANMSEDDELREFSETLLRKDTNNVAKFVTINYQGKTTSRSQTDEAPLPLLSVSSEAFNVPTVAKLLLLHNNYILETNVNEHVTPQEKSEENDLLDAMISTQIMQHTRNFLVQKGKVAKDPKDFRDKLKELWFNMYSRGGGRIGSSGFEHVFLAEIKNDEVTGSHNWLYFNDAEAKKLVNYLGYMKKLEFGNKGAIVKHHFTLAGKDKPVGSMFIGTSPELEIALYTTCFFMRPNAVCPLKFGGNKFIVRTFKLRYRGKNMIGSAFPEI